MIWKSTLPALLLFAVGARYPAATLQVQDDYQAIALFVAFLIPVQIILSAVFVRYMVSGQAHG